MSLFNFTYTIVGSNRARLGILTTPHGVIETPAFIFCATKASIKGVTPHMMRDADTQIILSNTYHLFLQPGADIVAKAGGLHRFMGWDGPMLTDSGGFQIFSLGHGSVSSEIKGKRNTHRPQTLLKITEEGAKFRSYIDGKIHLLTPEKSIETQVKLGADLIVSFDECTPFNVDKNYTAKSMRMSHRWGVRSLAEFHRLEAEQKQRLYGIIQGGVYEDLRLESCDNVNNYPYFGHAIGGSLGADKTQMYDVVTMTASKLDPKRPIHLLGIGGVKDVFKGVEQGIDTFDCVHPTRLARHGGALVRPPNNTVKRRDNINLNNGWCRDDHTPIEPDCGCYTCSHYSKAYLHHLLKAGELLAHTLITVHNVFFMNRLMKAVRTALSSARLNTIYSDWVNDD
ncbi:MAG: tRNA guanosine(34) transglycosylase Tgt [Alphaproteobacteria bacterium]|nr:tRNA guanosine(34) transglycosylase Tgt [Alphaproteobacteria bacterium]